MSTLTTGALTGKVAWITGGGTGIGRAGAEALAAAGATIAVSGRRRNELDETVRRIEAAGARGEAHVLDVADPAAVKRVAEAIIGRHKRLDILVNSAGINLPKRFWKNVEVEGWRQIVDVNLNGMLYCMHAVLPTMRSQRDGVIINVSSWAGRHAAYLTGPAYNATKHAVVALTHDFNMEECVNGLRATCIMPGEANTPIMTNRPVPPAKEELERMMQPEDLGRAIRFIAEMPPRVCVNEMLISPTWNRIFLGGADIAKR